MSLIAGIKVLGDLCFYFSIISELPLLFSQKIVWLWPAVICALGAALAVRIHEWTMAHGKSTRWRYGAAILPLSVLGWAATTLELVVLMPVSLYTILVIHSGVYSLEYFKYRKSFEYSMILWGIVFVICFLVESLTRPLGGKMIFDYEMMMAYGLAYGICAVFLLRHLRMGLSGTWKRSALNGGEMASVGIFAAGCSVVIFGAWALYLHFRDPINGFFTRILSVIVLIPVMIQQSIGQGIQNMEWGELAESVAKEQEKNMEFLNPPTLQEAPVWETIRENPLVQPADSIPWWLVLLVVLILSAALWKMLSVYVKTAPTVVRSSISGTTGIKPAAAPGERRSPREKVRRCYRDFLKLMEQKGFKREEYHTSEDILAAVDGMVSPEAAAALRRVYIAARYDENSVVTEEQVKQARRALKELKEHK